jgi:hypothetical protein
MVNTELCDFIPTSLPKKINDQNDAVHIVFCIRANWKDIRKHKYKEKVKVAMTLPKRDQKAAFDNFRPEGVLKTNIVEAGKV